MNRVGRQQLRDNIGYFWEVVEECWQVRDVAYKNLATQLRGNFLYALSQLFSEHPVFWKGRKLVVSKDFRNKLKTFKLTDRNIAAMASGGTKDREVLYEYLLKHVNSGRRTGRLVSMVNLEMEETEEIC
jgi:hypothetical protein